MWKVGIMMAASTATRKAIATTNTSDSGPPMTTAMNLSLIHI